MIRPTRLLPLGLACLAAAGPARAAEPAPDNSKARETIKSQKYEVQPVPYRDEGREDPFVSKVPLKAAQSRDRWKVRIGGLRLSSVMSGHKRVALFTETYGPSYSYILVGSVLIGPDHRAIPGIAGTIEPLGTTGNFKVTLRQGTEKVEQTFIKLDEDMRKRAAEIRSGEERERRERAGSRAARDSSNRTQIGGGDR